MSEKELKPVFAIRNDMEIEAIDLDVLERSFKGVKKQYENERYPDRKQRLKEIKNQLEHLILRMHGLEVSMR